MHVTLKPILPLRIALMLATAVLLTVGLVAATAADAKTKEGPSGGAFYKPPKNVPKGHGKVIWQRDSTKLAPIQGAKVNKTILYTSKSPQGKQIAVSGSVSIPKGKAPKGGWPVISWAHGTTGAADSCAPTRVRPNSPVGPYVAYVKPQLQDWIDAGYAVVATDYQGLGTPGPHPYLVGEAEGRSVLDMVSAAQQLKPSIGNKFLIAGHSQGGQSALFAASLAKSFSPKLKLKGTVSYAPASHIYQQAQLLPALTSPERPVGPRGADLRGRVDDVLRHQGRRSAHDARRRRCTRRSIRPAWPSSRSPTASAAWRRRICCRTRSTTRRTSPTSSRT